MKTFLVRQKSFFETMNGEVKELNFGYLFLTKQEAEERIRLYEEYYNEHPDERDKGEQLYIEEREEKLVLFEGKIWLPETIKVDGKECPLIIKEGEGYKGRPVVYVVTDNGLLDVTLALGMLYIDIERFNEYQTYKNDCWRGRNKYLIGDAIFREMGELDGRWNLHLTFTTNAYLDARCVISTDHRLEPSPRDKRAMSLRRNGESFIGMNVYF